MKARLIQSLGNREVKVTKIKIGSLSGMPILFFKNNGVECVEHFDEERDVFGVIGWVDDEVKQEIMLLRLT